MNAQNRLYLASQSPKRHNLGRSLDKSIRGDEADLWDTGDPESTLKKITEWLIAMLPYHDIDPVRVIGDEVSEDEIRRAVRMHAPVVLKELGVRGEVYESLALDVVLYSLDYDSICFV